MEHEVEIGTGRRGGDGHIRVSIFAEQLIALTAEGHGERAPTLLLTLEQVRRLEQALAEMIPLLEKAEQQQRQSGPLSAREAWRGEERRTSGALG
jgi:hypothetical protein